MKTNRFITAELIWWTTLFSNVFSTSGTMLCLACMDPEFSLNRRLFMDRKNGREMGLPIELEKWSCKKGNFTEIDCDYSCLHIRMTRINKKKKVIHIGDLFDCSNEIVRRNPYANASINYRNFIGNTSFEDTIENIGVVMNFTYRDHRIEYPVFIEEEYDLLSIAAFGIGALFFLGFVLKLFQIGYKKFNKKPSNSSLDSDVIYQKSVEESVRISKEYQKRMDSHSVLADHP